MCEPTLRVAAGLGESLAVCEQSDPCHCDSQHTAVLTGFILRGKQQAGDGNQKRAALSAASNDDILTMKI